MRVKKSFYSVGVWLVLSLLVLTGCGPVSQFIIETVPSLPGNAAAQESAVEAESPALALEAEVEPATTFSQGTVLDELQATLSGIYEDVNPSVVSIQVTRKVSTMMRQLPFPGSPPPADEQFSQGSGSGFVWDQQGHIITNYHVVEDAERIRVRFYDGASAVAELVGADRDSDMAVLKVNVASERLRPVAFADSTQVRVGQLAIAIGNPFGLENTMTVGFVSAVGRSLPVQAEVMTGARYTIPDVIQTDAPINPGNSGGVLVNQKGEVIGVTTAIISPVRASVGIGFAVPSAIVEKIVPALIAEGRYTHAWLGISGTTLRPDVAQAMDLDEGQRGALVITVQEDGPAGQAGLRGSNEQTVVDGQALLIGGDIIIAFGGSTVNTFEDLVASLARFSADETVTLTVIREGVLREMEVTLGARPQSTAIVPVTPPQQDEPATPQVTAWLGIMAVSINPQLAEAMDLPADQQGVLVGLVLDGSPADKAGLRGSDKPVTLDGQEIAVGGDVIIAWNGEALASMPELQARVRRSQPGDEVTLTILRDGRQQDITVTLAARP